MSLLEAGSLAGRRLLKRHGPSSVAPTVPLILLHVQCFSGLADHQIRAHLPFMKMISFFADWLSQNLQMCVICPDSPLLHLMVAYKQQKQSSPAWAAAWQHTLR